MSTELNSRFELNNQIARANRAAFDAAGVSVISIVGPPGSGKTSLIEALICHLDRRVRTACIVGNLAAARQAATEALTMSPGRDVELMVGLLWRASAMRPRPNNWPTSSTAILPWTR